MGLDPRTLGSHPKLEADAQPLSHTGIPTLPIFQEKPEMGSLGGAAVWRLPLAQGAILDTRDRI